MNKIFLVSLIVCLFLGGLSFADCFEDDGTCGGMCPYTDGADCYEDDACGIWCDPFPPPPCWWDEEGSLCPESGCDFTDGGGCYADDWCNSCEEPPEPDPCEELFCGDASCDTMCAESCDSCPEDCSVCPTCEGEYIENCGSLSEGLCDSSYFQFIGIGAYGNLYATCTWILVEEEGTCDFDDEMSYCYVPEESCVNLTDSDTYAGKITGNMTAGFTVLDSITLCEDTYEFGNVNALTIGANDVVIDCNNSIISSSTGDCCYKGIYNNGYTGMTVSNCNIIDYYYGAQLKAGSDNSSLVNNTFTNNLFPLSLYSNNTDVLNNTFGAPEYYTNIEIRDNISGTFVAYNDFVSGTGGIMFYRAFGNTVINNTFSNLTGAPVYLAAENGEYQCNNIIANNTGEGGLPIIFSNETIILEDQTISELFLCNADDSFINNVTVIGSLINGYYISAIYLLWTDNATITNCNSSNNVNGISFETSHNNTIYNSTFNYNFYSGIQLYESNGNNITQSIANNNSDGEENGYGLYMYGSPNNTVTSCTFNYNLYEGIYIDEGSDDNEFEDNSVCFNNVAEEEGVYDISDLLYPNNNWLSTNYQTSDPANSTYFNQTGTCGGEEVSCGDTITEDLTLTENLVSCEGTGLIIGADNITLDCAGEKISGQNNDNGILIDGRNNITIKNCTIESFSTGINVTGNSDYGLIQNNIIKDNTNDGITIRIGINYTVFDNSLLSNGGRGVYVRDSSFISLMNNNASFNTGDGLEIEGGFGNDMINNTAMNNTAYGMHTCSNSGGLFANNTAIGNNYGFHLSSVSSTTFENNTAIVNNYGFHIVGSTDCEFINNTASYNTNKGFLLSLNSNGNTLIDNTACGNLGKDIEDEDYPENNWSNTNYTTSTPDNSTYFDRFATCGVCLLEPSCDDVCGEIQISEYSVSHSPIFIGERNCNNSVYMLHAMVGDGNLEQILIDGQLIEYANFNTSENYFVFCINFTLLGGSDNATFYIAESTELTCDALEGMGLACYVEHPVPVFEGNGDGNNFAVNDIFNDTFGIIVGPNYADPPYLNHQFGSEQVTGYTLGGDSCYSNDECTDVCEEEPEPSLPINVTLTYPDNEAIIETNSTTLNYTVNIEANCTVYHNKTGWGADCATNNTEGASCEIDVLENGVYEWNVYCVDSSNASNNAWGETNWTFTVNVTGPEEPVNVTLVYPTDSETLDTNATTLNYTVNIESNCTVYHNISGSWTGDCATNETTGDSCTVEPLANGVYIWNVYCIGAANASNNAWGDETNWTFTINYTAPTPYSGCVDLLNESTYQGLVANVSGPDGILYVNGNVTLCTDTYELNAGSGQAALFFNCTHCYLECNGSIINGTDDDGDGITINSKEFVNISNCQVVDYATGISLVSSSNNTLTNNTASSNEDTGIYLTSSSNTLTNNTASSNNGYGILLDSSSNNTLTNNTVTFNIWDGIYLWSSSNNTLSNNTASNNNVGIYLSSSSNNTLTSNTASSNDFGIYLYSSSNNTLTSNNASENTEGIFLELSSNNTLTNNTAPNNWAGIFLDSNSNSNTLTNNTACENSDRDIYLSSNSNNNEGDNICNILFDDDSNTLLTCNHDCSYVPSTCVNLSDNSTWGSRVYTVGPDELDMFLLDEGELYSIYYVINESVSLCFDEYVDMPLVVNVSDVYIDCNGSTLLGNGTGIGVYPYNVSNFRLENCTIENYAMGVLAYFVDESNIHNVSISYGEIDESEFIIAGILNYNTSATVFSEINLNYLSNQSVPLFSYISTDNTFTNISSYSASGIGVLVYFGLNNTFENIISITETDALFDFTAGAFSLLGSFNSTFINVTGESDFVGLVLEESTGNNFTDSVFIGRGDIVMGGEVCSNNFTNVNGTDDRPILFYNGAQNLDSIEASAIILCNADYSNLTDSYINNSGIWLFNTSYSNINNSDSLAWYVSIFVDENSSYNNISNMTLSTEMYETVVIEGANNRLINSSLTSFDEWAVIYNLGINSSFLHNNITGALWVEDYSDTSDYNDSTSGNRYYFANGTGSWELFEIFDLNDDNWADVGRDYPFRHETLGDYWIGNGTDWHPWTDVEPSGVYCGYEVDSDISLDANLSCFADSGLNVIADNITIDCQGYSITGDNAGIGINIRGFNNTEIINCEIENFVYGIYADDANNTFISDSYIHNNSCDGIYFYSPDVGIYLDLTVVDTILENNDGVCDDDTGIMNSFSNLDLWNSQFINNGDYGINYDGEESLTIWTIDEYALCRNNAISFRGELVFDGGYLELDNCTLSIENPETNITSEWDIDGNYTDIILGIEVEENETETFELPNSDLEIDLTANETYNFSISVRLLNSTEVNDTNPDLPIGKVPFKGITIEVKDTAYLSWAIIRVYYNPTELNDLNIDEDSLRMYYFNETSDEWELVIQQGIIKVNPRHVWGNVTHFSTYALFGEETEEDGGSPGGSSYTGGGARPVGQSPITTEEEELQIDEEELEEEIIVPEKPSEEIPDEKPIDTTKPYVPPTIEETPEEKPVISSLIIGIVLFVIIVFILFIAYRKRQIKKNPLKGKRLV